MSIEPRRFLSVRELSEQSGHCAATVREWIHSGKLPAVRLGRRRYRVDEQAFIHFIESRRLGEQGRRVGV